MNQARVTIALDGARLPSIIDEDLSVDERRFVERWRRAVRDRQGFTAWAQSAARECEIPLLSIGPIKVWASRRTQIVLSRRGRTWSWPR